MEAIKDQRTCDKCGETVVEGQPDPCIGYIEGVSAACCGHGKDEDAYVAFDLPDGGFAAWDGGFVHMSKEELAEAYKGATVID